MVRIYTNAAFHNEQAYEAASYENVKLLMTETKKKRLKMSMKLPLVL